MRCKSLWTERPPEKDGVRNVVYSLAFSPDGTRIVAAVGPRVLVFDHDGTPLHSLKGHKDAVYCVAYSSDGDRFASGGADNTVIIWKSTAQGILKYTHTEPIQALAYNPVTQQLASASSVDFGLWSPEQRSVTKKRMPSRVLCMAWTHDGQLLALGCADGSVSVKDKVGEPRVEIQRGGAPVWSLDFSPPGKDGRLPHLAVGSWDGTLSFYESNGAPVGKKDVELGFNPCCVSYMSDGDFILVSGTNRKCVLYTKEGLLLDTVTKRESWVWCCAARPGGSNSVVTGCEDGSINMAQITFCTVHGIYKDRYAHRDLMTDVVIQHLGTDQRVRIKCRDYVRRISVYQSRIAVQLSDRIIIYDPAPSDDGDSMLYKSVMRINKKLECSLLVVTSQHVILCQEKKLLSYNFEGDKVREWVVDAQIKYIKVVGGPPGGEGLVVGLRDGSALQIFVNNPFPILLWKHHTALRCVDLSCRRNLLALIDDNSRVVVVDLRTKSVKFEEEKATSVAFNTECEDMVAYSGVGMLSIRTGNFAPLRQRTMGFVVAYEGSKVYCLLFLSMQAVDVPHSGAMQQYIEVKDWANAYQVACLGVTFEDWQQLGEAALLDLDIECAHKALVRTQDLLLLSHLSRVERLLKAGVPANVLKAEVLAHQGRYDDAAELFAKAGAPERAMEMWTDLRQFDKASKWATSTGKAGSAAVEALLQQQAQWSEEVRDYRAAAEMYASAGKHDKAVAILAKHCQDWGHLLETCRKLDRTRDEKALQIAASALIKHEEFEFAKELLMKLEDWPALIELHVQSGAWQQAFMTAKRCPGLEPALNEKYALWLLENDRFDDARQAYAKSGKPHLATRILEELCYTSAIQKQFADAAYYFYQRAMEALDAVAHTPGALTDKDRKALDHFTDLYGRAEIYYAYDIVSQSMGLPFRLHDADTVFNAARFLFMRLVAMAPPWGISVCCVVHELARVAEEKGAWKLARFAYQRLHSLRVPPEWQKRIDVQSVAIRAKPLTNAEHLTCLCWRCGASNNLVNSQGDYCPSCGAEVVRSFVTFEALPLVEFELEEGISDEEAERLLLSAGKPARRPPVRRDETGNSSFAGREGAVGSADVLRLEEDLNDLMPVDDDAFAAQMKLPNMPIVADRNILRQLNFSEVLVRRWPNKNVPAQYFRVMDPLVDIVCGPCGHFFEADEYEMWSLANGKRPFSWAALPADATEV